MEHEVQIVGGQSAAQVFYDVLCAAVSEFPEAFNDLTIPTSLAAFRKQYIDFLPQFETARLTSCDRQAIAVYLARAYLDMGDDDGARQILDEVVAEGGTDLKAEAKALLDRIGT